MAAETGARFWRRFLECFGSGPVSLQQPACSRLLVFEAWGQSAEFKSVILLV